MSNDLLGNVPQSIVDLSRKHYGDLSDSNAKAGGFQQGDYDYSAGGSLAENGHYGDLGKLPWHPTFSDQSKYSSPEFRGGTWDGGPGTGQTQSYTPSRDMIQAGTTDGLVAYMKRVEPGVELKAPEGYSIVGDKFVQNENWKELPDDLYAKQKQAELFRFDGIQDATGQMLPAGKIFNTKVIDLSKKIGSGLYTVVETPMNKVANEVLDKTVNPIESGFRSMSNLIDKINPDRNKLDVKSASIGIRG